MTKLKKKVRNKLMEEINGDLESLIDPFKYGSKNKSGNPLSLTSDSIPQFCIMRSMPGYMR